MNIPQTPNAKTSPAPKVIPYYAGHFFIYLGCLLVALVVGWLIIKAGRMNTAYRTVSQNLAFVQQAASAETPLPAELDPTEIESLLAETVAAMETLHTEMTPFLPLTPHLGWVPVYGGDIQAAPYLVSAGLDGVRAGNVLASALSPVWAMQAEPKQDKVLAHLIVMLLQTEPELETAGGLLTRAGQTLSAVDIETLSPPTAARVELLARYLDESTIGVQGAKILPDLLGARAPRTYLLLTQNSDELRPSGGYINAAGHIVLAQGRIVEFVVQDSYAIDRLTNDYPWPPDPLYRYMGLDYWMLRDAGWSPDFPTAARTAMELYRMGQDISVDGVIALDQQAFPDILRATGPLRVEGERVASDNVIELMRRHWQPEWDESWDGEWWLNRKSFMMSLAEVVRLKFEQDFGSIDFLTLTTSLKEALAEKHIQLYLDDPAGESILAEKNWAGALRPATGDYLMVVDANVGYNKAGAVVDRHLAYRLDLAPDGSGQAGVTLTYRHQAPQRNATCSQAPRYNRVYEQNMVRCYWDYVRVIAPAGAKLLHGPDTVVDGRYLLRGQSTTGEIDVELFGDDKVGWGQLFLLEPQETISLDYGYALPQGTARVDDGRWVYTLLLQKQPGTLETVADIILTLPEGMAPVESTPPPSDRQGRTLTYNLATRIDQEIRVVYAGPKE